ncbi:UDP-N-acetylglucosamine--N-acetylmuramyl-(pentapeptide) pyrophosphoryl-undecaprenol N-acetylglucosamine transferase [Streptococcus ictaluri]|uniref:Glycosyltransferase family 28 N-terminal domain protein n=1 Tax=Streptococcus ictaluri 707-05 TaxID=764299 RepID=G5K5Q0_9STRE|nr:UDP-N-acetylglucosamine--N-acetylmuramyl-(pentapeptide) pyrophosphoryl-undecaprenol N-acetylglucosamine transferase [Streptococcus ictaluri]EHI68770.1 glycosyltransferase family 28 N-terminal domain protein [Streptococcus ictaluri 707-05]
MAKKIVFTGGGTVGHVTLNLILMPKFIKDGWQVHYIGDKNGIEFKEIQKSGLEVVFHSISTGKLRRYFSWQNALDVFKVGKGLTQSLAIMAKIKPDALFSKGGFVSVPPVIAAKLLGIPVFVHESDLSMGLANKIAYRFATLMYTTFDQNDHQSKMKHVGAVTKVSKDVAFNKALVADVIEAFDSHFKTLLFIGGSAGAKVFNTFVTDHPELTESYNIINITGDSSLNHMGKNLYRVDYVTDLYQPLMGLADVVVTRGGSNTLFELLAMQKLHLIVPLGKEASRGDQLENAHYFESKGYAKQLLEEQFNIDNLQTSVDYLLSHEKEYKDDMAAAKEIKSPDTFYGILTADIAAVLKEK